MRKYDPDPRNPGTRAVSEPCYYQTHARCPGTAPSASFGDLTVPCECRCHAVGF